MKYSVNIFKNPYIVSFISGSIVMLMIAMFIGLPALQGETGKLILNLDQNRLPVFGDAGMIFSIFGILFAVIVLNSILIFELYNRERFMAYLIAVSTALISLVALIVTWMVVGLN